jgi:altronate hydrolase
VKTTPEVLSLKDCTLRLAAGDEVAVATRDLASGTVLVAVLAGEAGPALVVRGDVPRGHKIALADVPAGAAVHKYGQSIGRALTGIRRGDHVHTHNLGMDQVQQDYEFGTARVTPQAPPGDRPTFKGYRRANGKAGTRNYVGILTSVNCSASTARMIADQFRGAALDAFPNVDGVFALTHGSGCGMVLGSAGAEVLVRTLRGYAHHPNFAGLLVLGLGCEMLQTERFLDEDTWPGSSNGLPSRTRAESGQRSKPAWP